MTSPLRADPAPDATTLPRGAVAGLRVAGASVRRGGALVLRDVRLDLAQGEALVVTGPNGAGKSTLLRALAGLLPLSAGSLGLRDGAGATLDEPVGAHAHYVGHAEALKDALSPRETLDFWAAMLRADAVAGQTFGAALSADAALAAFDLAHAADFPVAYLSAGQRRRAALARLLVAPRPLWLLDEPATALDAASQARLAQIMAGHLAAGGMIVAATHAPLGLEGARTLALPARFPAAGAAAEAPGAAS